MNIEKNDDTLKDTIEYFRNKGIGVIEVKVIKNNYKLIFAENNININILDVYIGKEKNNKIEVGDLFLSKTINYKIYEDKNNIKYINYRGNKFLI